MKQTQNSRLARGCEQSRWMNNMLLASQCSVERELRGRARSYAGHYVRSFANLLDRMTAAGYTIVRTPGVRGGEWGASYRAIAPGVR